MTIDELKNYLKVEHSEDDSLLQVLKETAEAYINSAIEFEETIKQDKRYTFATVLLIAHWYENRSETTTEGLNNIPFGVNAFIQQLRGR